MVWTLCGIYMILLECSFGALFLWTRHVEPAFALGNGHWIAGLMTIAAALLALILETFGRFAPDDSRPSIGGSLVRSVLHCATAGFVGWQLAPFALGAWQRLFPALAG